MKTFSGVFKGGDMWGRASAPPQDVRNLTPDGPQVRFDM